MEKFTKDISEIILTEVNTINGKVKGLNFLELLKSSIIEKLSQLVEAQKFPLEQSVSNEHEIKNDSRHIKILVNYFSDTISISKKIIVNDTLLINFNEIINVDIFKDEKNFKSILLYKSNGISLPQETVVNSKYNKNLLLIEIINIESY